MITGNKPATIGDEPFWVEDKDGNSGLFSITRVVINAIIASAKSTYVNQDAGEDLLGSLICLLVIVLLWSFASSNVQVYVRVIGVF